MKLGLVVFANNSGLGNQTKRLAEMLRPDRILAIDSTPFSKNKKQNWGWYEGFSGYKVDGFPTTREVKIFLKGLTHVLLCENPLNFDLISEAKKSGIKTYIQSNYEFCDNLLHPQLPVPDYFLMPSYWKVEEMKRQFGDDKVAYLPPPIDPNEFKDAREQNFARDGGGVCKLLHVVGTLAAHDRNGTLDLLRAIPHIEGNYHLTIKSQHPLPSEYMVSHHRVSYKIENEMETQQLYKDFDALVLPRRYGGLTLTCNEALMSGIPVIMSDISPNNKLLPDYWLVKATHKEQFMARTMIDVFETSPIDLAAAIDFFIESDRKKMKIDAFELAYTHFSTAVLKSNYDELWK